MNFKLEESNPEKVPSHLEDILKRILYDDKPSDLKEIDIFLILIIVVMSENGFFIKVNDTIDKECLQLIDNKQMSKWKYATGVYELEFVMNGYNDTLIKLIMYPLASSSVINVLISDISSDVYTVCVPLNRYVISVEAVTIPMMFCDLKHLSNLFKDKIITPVKSIILNYYGYSGASLIGLPEELLYSILLYLPLHDITNVAKTCKRLHFCINNENLWHKLLVRDFTKLSSSDNHGWQEMYKNAYIMHHNLKQSTRSLSGTLHDFMDISDYVSHIDNPMWDEFI